MDTFAKGLLIAYDIIRDKALSGFVDERYSSFNSGIGARIMNGNIGLEEIEKWIQPFRQLLLV